MAVAEQHRIVVLLLGFAVLSPQFPRQTLGVVAVTTVVVMAPENLAQA